MITVRTTLGLVVLGLSGCTFNFWNKDFVTDGAKLAAPPFDTVTLGMLKSDVSERLGPPDQVIGARRDGVRQVEMWEYHRFEARPGPDRIAERYQVVFTDGRLSSYESSGDYRQQIIMR
jgi:hypothetical protein